MLKRILFLSIATMLLVWPSALTGQQRPGKIRGRVADVSGNPAANLTITVRSVSTGNEQTAQTDQNGGFSVDELQPGQYLLLAQNTQQNVAPAQSTVNSACTTDLTLQTTTMGLAVQAEVVTQEEGTAPVENTFTERQIELLPSPNAISRTGEYFGAYNLSLLSEGVTPGSPIQNGVGPAVGGRPNTSNNFMVNGIDNNNQATPGPLVTVSNEVTNEFSLMQNPHAPQVGQSTGGKLNLVLAQGTNAWHGGVYDYLNNRKLNASDPAAGIDSDLRYDQNRMGGKIGGAILQDKLFAFFGLEYTPLRTQRALFGPVLAPTPAGFAALRLTPGVSTTNLAVLQNNVQVSTTPVAVATVGTTTIPLGVVNTNVKIERNFWNGMTVWDWAASARSSFAARYVHNDTGTDTFGNALPAFTVPGHNRALVGALSYSQVFGVATALHLNAGYNRLDRTLGGGSFTFPGLDAFPNINIQPLGLTLGSNVVEARRAKGNTYQGTAEVDWTTGGHHMTFGVDARRIINSIGTFPSSSGLFGFSSLERFLLDLPPDVIATRTFGSTSYHGNQWLWYLYGQDSLRVTPSLNLEFGLGYEYATIPASLNRQADLASFSVPGLVVFDEPQTGKLNLAPRFGFAWSPGARKTTVVRGSAGIMYDALNGNSSFLAPDLTFGTVTTSTFNTPGFFASGGVPVPTTVRSGIGTFVPEQELPYILYWTGAVSHEFFDRVATEIKYMGNHGVHMPFVTLLNDPRPFIASSSLPVFFTNPGQATIESLRVTQSALAARTDAFTVAGFTNPIRTVSPAGTSWYNAVALKISERFTAGTQVAAQYTYSDNRTDAIGTPLDLAFGRSMEQAPWNQKHRATITPILDVASMFPGTGGWVRNILANMSLMATLTYASAQELPVLSGIDPGINGIAAGSGVFVNPNGIAGVGTGTTPLRNSSGQIVGFVANDPSAQFVVGGPGTFSTARPTIRLGDTRNIDLSLVKRFSVPEGVKIEIRGDSYNLFNRRQLTGLPVSTLGSGLGLTATPNFLLAPNPQFSNLRGAISSNPRTFQLALRVIF